MILRRHQSSALINALLKTIVFLGAVALLMGYIDILQYLNNPHYTSHQQTN